MTSLVAHASAKTLKEKKREEEEKKKKRTVQDWESGKWRRIDSSGERPPVSASARQARLSI